MKKILFSLIIILSAYNETFSQTTLVVDANQVLTSNTKLILQTAAGQSFFTGHQLGSTYSIPVGIFKAITDNPNGTLNYYYDGVTNGTTNYSVRADGQGFFAGSLGIGRVPADAKFSVFQSATLGTVQKNNTLLSTISGSAGTVNTNTVKNNLWLVRNSSGTEWLTTSLHDGISIDASFVTPQVDTRTWWERDPADNIQSWGDQGNTYMTLAQGNVGIGTTDTKGYKLAVNGKIRAMEIKVEAGNWPDYVFNRNYVLKPLSVVKAYIDQNHHLPELPSAKEVSEKGLDLGETNKLLLKKIEELTLYLIQMNEEIQKLKQQNKITNTK